MIVSKLMQVYQSFKNQLKSFKESAPVAFKLSKFSFLSVSFLLIFYLCIEFNFLWLFGKVPTLKELANPPLELASELYSADGKLLGRYYRENRSPVSYNKISPYFVKGLIAVEDVRFFAHSGIDYSALVSVIWYSLKGDRRGGSTLTQQLAKNLFKTRKKDSQGLLGYIPGVKTVVFKLKEWIVAIKLEKSYSKEEILRLYMNTVDFGSQSFGIRSAAKTFFGKSPDSLFIQEAAVLVGVLKAPTLYSPVLHPLNALNRRNVVLGLMAKHKIVTQKEADSLIKLPLELEYKVDNQLEGTATYLRGIVGNFLKKWCDEKGYDLYADGFKIYTTIDSRLQEHAEAAMMQHMKELQARFFRHWKDEKPWIDENKVELPNFIETAFLQTEIYRSLMKKYKNQDSVWAALKRPKRMKVFTWNGDQDTTFSSFDSLSYYKKILQAGFMTFDPFSGHIKTWVGGINYKYFKFDHVSQSKRQPGSTFKPFVYCAALDKGYSPCQRILDEPTTINYEEDGQPKTWMPRNSDWIYTRDSMTLRRAMAKSVNSITAKLTMMVTPDSVVAYAHRCGIKSKIKSVPSVGLGSSDVSLYEMVGAYGTFMNYGEWTEPIFITKIVGHDGKTVVEFAPKRKKAIKEETAYLMMHMLKGGTEEPGGTAQGLFPYQLWRGNELGGKTGTSTNHSDGWFMCVTNKLVGGVWVGAEDRSVHFRTSSMGEGMRTALPIMGLFLERVYADKQSGIKMGYFAKPRVPINVRYRCTTVLPKVDSSGMVPPPDSVPVIEVPETSSPDIPE